MKPLTLTVGLLCILAVAVTSQASAQSQKTTPTPTPATRQAPAGSDNARSGTQAGPTQAPASRQGAAVTGKAKTKRAAGAKTQNQPKPQTIRILVPGNFAQFLDPKAKSACPGKPVCARLVAADEVTIIGEPASVNLSPRLAELTYQQTDIPPAYVFLGKTNPPDNVYILPYAMRCCPPKDSSQKPADQTQPAQAQPGSDQKPSAATVPAAPALPGMVKKNSLITGDFTTVTSDLAAHKSADAACKPLEVCAVLLDKDQQTTIGRVDSIKVGPDKVSLDYEAPPGITPTFIRLGTSPTSSILYNFTPGAGVAAVQQKQVITADFCQKELVNPKPAGATSPYRCSTTLVQPDTALKDITGFVQDANNKSVDLAVTSISEDKAGITFSAEADFRPAWVALAAKNRIYRFAYAPAPPLQTGSYSYTAEDVENLCNKIADNKSDCAATTAEDIVLRPANADGKASFIAIQDKLLFARVTAAMGDEPTALIASRTFRDAGNNITQIVTTIVRRTIKPAQNINVLQADMTILDQDIVERDYGNRIAKRYLAINLDIRNPTDQKLQFKKSAMYFDVDYVRSQQKGFWWFGFIEEVKSFGTFGLYGGGNPYNNSFEPASPPRQFRYGLEQNVKHSPLNYLNVLASYDYTTEKTENRFRFIELVGSILTTISTGNIVAQKNNTAFHDAASVFASSFLPGLRSIILNLEGINRRRANLVAQTLQDATEIPPHGSTSTIVLLPRAGILAFDNAKVPVMINKVLDVHLVPEIITPINTTPIEKGSIKPGYTKDQVRQACGEPTGIVTNADGTSMFSYAKGVCSDVTFDKNGVALVGNLRSLDAQLAQTTSITEARDVLKTAGRVATSIDLVDGSVIFVDIPDITTALHFDSTGKKIADYPLLFADIKGFEGKTKADLDKFLVDKALSTARKTGIQNEASSAKGKPTTSPVQYESPDIATGAILVTFKDDSGKISDTSTILKINFMGPRPKNVD